MNNNIDLHNNLNIVFGLIEEAIDDDNIINEDEFLKIQKLKKEFNITSTLIHDKKKVQIERILYLQFYLLLFDDNIDFSERQELEYYKKIFGYSETEIFRIELKVRQDKQQRNESKLSETKDLSSIEHRSRNIPSSIKKNCP